jgi:glycerophosphoryl diester phosphodiesterase
MSSRFVASLVTVFAIALFGLPPTPGAAEPRRSELSAGSSAWTVADLYASPTPYALGHRGYGADAVDPSGPLENTLDAFHQAFRDGIRVVELDLQRTADGKVVVFHDDFLQDFTCVNALTYDELLARFPQVPLFRAVLNSSRHFAFGDELSGIIFAEIKVPAPLCDAGNTSEQAEVSESALVAAVVDEIRAAQMQDQVILNAGSPSILARAALRAPEIRRALSLNALQLLTPEQACQVLPPPLCPVRIPKNDCGLEWYNIGPIARLPRYLSFPQFLGTALGCAGSSAVSLDRLVLLPNPAVASAIVAAVHGQGLETIVWTVNTEAEWSFMAAAGVDGITTDNIALGLGRQAPLPALVSAASTSGRRVGQVSADGEVAGPRLELYPSRTNPSRDGALTIDFMLPDAGPARLDLVDVAGRLVETSEVGSLGGGRHAFSLGGNLRPGVYLVRLSHAQGERSTKVAVVN